jgi:hypothetical protein
METIRKIHELDPSDIPIVERVFGLKLDATTDAVLILRVASGNERSSAAADDAEIPSWCNVLEGMSDEDLADFDAILNSPVRLAHPQA